VNVARVLHFAGAVMAASALASAASAAITITDVEAGNGNGQFGTIDMAGWGQPWTTPLVLTDTTGRTYVVFCDDLQHDIYIGGGQSLPFHQGLVQFDGFGALLGTFGGGSYMPAQYAAAEDISDRMGQLADIGRHDYLKGDLRGADAAQAAIWGIEYAQYGWTPSASDPIVQHDLQHDLNIAPSGRGWAHGLIAEAGAQSQILGAVPEPGVWTTMIGGIAMAGAALRRARRRLAA
jgi:hypothetical protein